MLLNLISFLETLFDQFLHESSSQSSFVLTNYLYCKRSIIIFLRVGSLKRDGFTVGISQQNSLKSHLKIIFKGKNDNRVILGSIQIQQKPELAGPCRFFRNKKKFTVLLLFT